MALTTEQQQQIEYQQAQAQINLANETKYRKMEAIRLAKDVLMENDRNKLVGDRGIAAQDLTAFADILVNYVNQ